MEPIATPYTNDIVTAVSVMFGNTKQSVSVGWGNWTRDERRRFVWSLAPFEGDRYALTVVGDMPLQSLKDGETVVLVINDVPHTVFWSVDGDTGMRTAHISSNVDKTGFVGYVSDGQVVRSSCLH